MLWGCQAPASVSDESHGMTMQREQVNTIATRSVGLHFYCLRWNNTSDGCCVPM